MFLKQTNKQRRNVREKTDVSFTEGILYECLDVFIFLVCRLGLFVLNTFALQLVHLVLDYHTVRTLKTKQCTGRLLEVICESSLYILLLGLASYHRLEKFGQICMLAIKKI